MVFASYQSTAYRDKVQVEDLLTSPQNLPPKVEVVSVWNLVIFILAMVYFVLAIIELLVYYRYMTFPIDTLRYFDSYVIKDRRNCI